MFDFRLGLKHRLLLMNTVLMLLLCLAGGIYIVARAQSDIRGEVRSTMSLVQRFLRAQLALSEIAWVRNNDVPPQLDIAQLRDVRHVQVVFYDNAGKLLESSADAQIAKAKAPAWFAWLVQRSFRANPDWSLPVAFSGVKLGDVVVHPDPTFEMEEIWNVAKGLLGLVLVFFVLVSVAIWWTVTRTMRPLAYANSALQRLGEGDLRARVPNFASPEMAGFSREFNRTAQALEQSSAENQNLMRRLIQAQEDERKRIAHELHDEIGQYITAIHAEAAAIIHSDTHAHVGMRESAAAIQDSATHIKSLVRGMLQRLRPAALDSDGLGRALREAVTTFRQHHPDIQCHLAIDSSAADLAGELGANIYRVVQESLTNIARHAQATNVEIAVRSDSTQRGDQLNFEQQSVHVSVMDNGTGFDTDAMTSGYGLIGMRERVQSLGGSLSIDSAVGHGTHIMVKLPLTENARVPA